MNFFQNPSESATVLSGREASYLPLSLLAKTAVRFDMHSSKASMTFYRHS